MTVPEKSPDTVKGNQINGIAGVKPFACALDHLSRILVIPLQNKNKKPQHKQNKCAEGTFPRSFSPSVSSKEFANRQIKGEQYQKDDEKSDDIIQHFRIPL